MVETEWTYEVIRLTRLEIDDGSGDDRFLVEFRLAGPDSAAEVEIFVGPGIEDEAELIAIAMDGLHRACESWAKGSEVRRIGGSPFVSD